MPQESRKLTDTFVRTRKPAKPGERDFTRSADHNRVMLCITDKLGPDKKPYVSFLYGTVRFPGDKSPTRRLLGTYPRMTIAGAHEKAREWDDLIRKGIDPRVHEERIAKEAEKAQQTGAPNTFAKHAADYIAFCEREGQRQVYATKRIISKELNPRWGNRPIDSITPSEVKDIIVHIAADRPAMARNVLVVCKTLFDWALDERSPAAALRAKKIVGRKEPRQRHLTDDELRAFWRATEELNYPDRELHQILLLTGVRLREAAGARWSEIDLDKRLWVIPPERFKSNTSHLVPLSPMVMSILDKLPRFQEGDHLFTHSCGRRAMTGFGKSKLRIDAKMAEQDHLKPWVVHDLRRVVRTGLAKLKVSDTIAEMALGHGHGNSLQRTYNLHQHEDELRDALELWAGRVRDIVTPPDPSKVTRIRQTA